MKVVILGTRGVPAGHGGFETFAENFSLYLHQHGHEVTVYCQTATVPPVREDVWRGVRRVHIQAANTPYGTIIFDWASLIDSLRRPGLLLILGYNTAIFSLLVRLCGRVSLMNMDGLEWQRKKWSALQRLWLRINEFAGAKLSTHLIADHPAIGRHLERYVAQQKITVIAYGADAVTAGQLDDAAWRSAKASLGLGHLPYSLVVARVERENAILEIVSAFSRRPREHQLLVIGALVPETNAYHRQIMEVASNQVIFAGAIYDRKLVENLRYHATVYFHGHCVGGTNPSLVEAMAAGNAIVAHDNVFTRWVTDNRAVYFHGSEDLASLIDDLLDDPIALQRLRCASRARHRELYTQEEILGAYTALLERFSPGR